MQFTTRTRSAAATLIVAVFASVVAGSALAGTIKGTPKNDVLRGTSAADKIFGGGGNDKIYGLGGGDRLDGGPGADQLTGGPVRRPPLRPRPRRGRCRRSGQDRVRLRDDHGPPEARSIVSDVSGEEGNSGTNALAFSVVLKRNFAQGHGRVLDA